MRFVNGPIPASQTLDPIAAGWTPLRISDSRRFVVVATLSTIPFLVAATWLLLRAAPVLRPYYRGDPWSLPCFLLLLLVLVPAHEFIHAVAYGCGLRSPNLVAGFWLRRGLAYVWCDEPLPRSRVLGMLAAPFCVLTVLPLCVTPFLSEPLLFCVLFFSVLHAALCVGDAATFLKILRQAPPRALIHNQGWQTYWTVPNDADRATSMTG
jgi:hypothetical protein